MASIAAYAHHALETGDVIIHTVLLYPKPETSAEEIGTALAHVQNLQRTIPGLLSVQAGPNLNSSNNHGYTYGFVMRFASKEHLRDYAPHPAHRQVSDELVSISQSIIDFDLETAS